MQCIEIVACLPFGGFFFFISFWVFYLGGRLGEWGTKVNGNDSISRLGSDFTLFYVWSGFFPLVTFRMKDWCWEEVFLVFISVVTFPLLYSFCARDYII